MSAIKNLLFMWRPFRGGASHTISEGTVGEFLSKEENYKGVWHIDVGQGYPPGPLRVEWDDDQEAWSFKGYHKVRVSP